MALIQLLKDSNGFKLVNGIYVQKNQIRQVSSMPIKLNPAQDKVIIYRQIENYVRRFVLQDQINSFYFDPKSYTQGYHFKFLILSLSQLPEQQIQDYVFPSSLLIKKKD